jgi:hypothetical protein
MRGAVRSRRSSHTSTVADWPPTGRRLACSRSGTGCRASLRSSGSPAAASPRRGSGRLFSTSSGPPPHKRRTSQCARRQRAHRPVPRPSPQAIIGSAESPPHARTSRQDTDCPIELAVRRTRRSGAFSRPGFVGVVIRFGMSNVRLSFPILKQ